MKKTIKKTTKKAELAEIELPVCETMCNKKVEIALISEEMGREDLNLLAKKINEVINSLN